MEEEIAKTPPESPQAGVNTPPVIVQAPSNPNQTLSSQSPQSQPTTTAEQILSSNQAPSRLFKPLIGILLLIAVGFIGYFIYTQSFSGTVEYETGPLTFSSGQVTQTVSQQLKLADNPYRPQVSLKYQRQIGGINIGSTLLASYTITINNQSQQSIYQDSGSFSFRDKDNDEGSGTSTVTSNTNSKDFLIENPGQYQLDFTAQVPEDLDSDFTVKSIQFRLRSQVKSAPIWMLLVGLVSFFAIFALIFIKRRSKK